LHVDLPSGNSVELRDSMLRGDRRYALKAAKLRINADRTQDSDMSFTDEVMGALMTRMIVGWTIPQHLPSTAQSHDLAQGILDALDDEDYEAIADKLRPMFDRIMRVNRDSEPPKNGSSGTGTGSSGAQEPNGPETQSM
jgi:hypothetical protein